jgi:hypothetical protein
VNQELITFINEFHKKFFRPHLYWKDGFGVMDMIGLLSSSIKILLIHTGGFKEFKEI